MKDTMKDGDTMTIRQMCDMFNVTPRTLRFYEVKELLSPIREGQKRLYTNRDRARLKIILRSKQFGLSLEEIRQILDLYNLDDQGLAQLQHSLKVGETRLDELVRQRQELGQTINELRALMQKGHGYIKKAETAAA